MPNRNQTQDQQQRGKRNPMQTTPDDDEAQVEDQTTLGAEQEGVPGEGTQNQPQQGRRRRNAQADQDQDQERVTQVEDEEAEDDEDDEEDGSGGRI
jgi:hypothetical protein